MSLRICIVGVTGWVGKPLSLAVAEAGDMQLVAAVSRSHAGRKLKEVGDADVDLTISGSVSEALTTPSDVLVDFTRADAVRANVLTAINKGVHVVIGTSDSQTKTSPRFIKRQSQTK